MTQTATPQPVYLTTEDIARRYNVNEDTARRWIRTGRITGVRLGGAYRVRLDDLQRLEREGEDFSVETPIERPEIDSLLQQLEDFAGDVPDRQVVHEILTELRSTLGEIPPEKRILKQIENLLHERVP
jgi:excisionase family DNA binding protein